MPVVKRLMLAAVAALAPLAAQAHVVADPPEAPAGTYQAVRFRVGHGCGDAATTALRIEIPAELAQARPQPKPGWTLTLSKEPAAPGGEPRTAAVAWRGELPADQFDEFAILARLPPTPGTLYFPTVQTCGADESQWIEIPDPGETGLSHPAPSVRVTPAPAAADAHHH